MIKHQFFVNKHLPVQTQGIINSNKRYSICLNFVNKDTFIYHKEQHRTLPNNFLGILQNLQINHLLKTTLDGYFKLATDFSLKSVT